MTQADIGLIGLAVMGENLVLNMANHNFHVAVYNRTVAKVDRFLAGRAEGKSISGFHSIGELCAALKRPRKVMLLVKAGAPVDELINQVNLYLEPGDIIIDGGNTHFLDTERRWRAAEAMGLRFIGTGVSGGEEGALKGPSLMPGGSAAAWPELKHIFQTIAAKVEDGSPCCDWVGPGGAGHFVKMVHNGIEYGDMQLICECYHIMKAVLGLSNQAMAETFAQWDKGVLNSYLIEITADILAKRNESGQAVVDQVLDSAGQKGTGRWTTNSALDLGVPVTLIAEAVFARMLSAQKDERVEAAKVLNGPAAALTPGQSFSLDDIRDALYAAKLVSYAQGFAMMRQAARDYQWELAYGAIALMWRGGCIIRSRFLGDIERAFKDNPALTNLLLDRFFTQELERAQGGWRRVVALGAARGIPLPALSSALAYFDGYRCGRLPANLLQAQRDYFGAHTYERVDRPRGEFFHTDWTGQGGKTAAGSYSA